MSTASKEIIVVRSLTESDLGIFAAHRESAKSKQRAINVNADIARRLLSEDVFATGTSDLKCVCVFGDINNQEIRRFAKTHKNWRLGGKKLAGSLFSVLDARDFVLIRSREANDGVHPITVTFISRNQDRLVHAGLVAILGDRLIGSMIAVASGDKDFDHISAYCPSLPWTDAPSSNAQNGARAVKDVPHNPMPPDDSGVPSKPKNIYEKLRQPHILERMLKAAGDLSAPAQLKFFDTVEKLAGQLREVLLATGRIVKVPTEHAAFWPTVKGQRIGFVDGGMANLSMLGSAPIAARVGGYVVRPGTQGDDREHFVTLKYLIDELYSSDDGGVYDDSFPDIGALRDAARISIEAAGAVRLLADYQDLTWVFLHGALVNPVSRYTDVMEEGRIRHRFPDFSDSALKDLLPKHELGKEDRNCNFIRVHQLQIAKLVAANAVVCGVVERESTTSSVCKAVLNSLDDEEIRDLLPDSPSQWKRWFLHAVDPSGNDDFEGQRITDSLLFRCVLESGEALLPVEIDRNEARRQPEAWRHVISLYPKPHVSYILVSEWSPPVRVELFQKHVHRFDEVAAFVLHCSRLLPRYAFPVGLDIVDKFARIPDWMSRPVNTHTAVRAMKTALDRGDTRLFDALRRMLCGSSRDFFLRPGIFR